MNPNVLVAAITAGSSLAIAITALVLNHRGFSDLRSEMNHRLAAIERGLDVIEADQKEFFKVLARHDTEIARLKDKTGLS